MIHDVPAGATLTRRRRAGSLLDHPGRAAIAACIGLAVLLVGCGGPAEDAVGNGAHSTTAAAGADAVPIFSPAQEFVDNFSGGMS